MTLGVSAMAAMTESVKSFGWGLVKRTRRSPSISPQARRSRANASRSPMAAPYVLTFWPNSVTSWTPSSARARTSARMSPGRRSIWTPRRAGTIQKVHVLLQPTEMATQAE